MRSEIIQRSSMVTEQELVELQETLYTSKNPTRRWLHCTRRDWIFDALRRQAEKQKDATSALEIGPGSGIYLPILANLYQEVHASDIEEAYLNNARVLQTELPNLLLYVDDITNSKISEKRFDLILCTEVVEHIPNSQMAIAQMHRLLKPGGVLILSTPQLYSPLELSAKIAFMPGIIQIVKMIYQEPILESGHINLMTEKKVENQITNAGFIIKHRHKTGMYIPLVAEFMGQIGLKIEQFLERKLDKSLFDWLLWTQYYIARA